MTQFLTILGTIVSVVSLAFAVIQTLRIANLRRLRVNSLRAALQNCRIPMLESDRLLNKRISYHLMDRGALIKLEAIHANSCGTLRAIFHELSQVDLPYDERRLQEYVSLNLITSKWLWTQAALFLPYPPDPSKVPDLPDDTPDLMGKAGCCDIEPAADSNIPFGE